jgi:uncharacterized protein YeaO (DUF488 family)
VRAETVAANIRLKRVYEPASPDDGYRLLATRYWPRGLRKDAVHAYQSSLAPSSALIKEYQMGGLAWQDFGRRYKQELSTDALQIELRRLAKLASAEVITLLCFCELEGDCHRTLLRDAIIESVKPNGGPELVEQ